LDDEKMDAFIRATATFVQASEFFQNRLSAPVRVRRMVMFGAPHVEEIEVTRDRPMYTLLNGTGYAYATVVIEYGSVTLRYEMSTRHMASTPTANDFRVGELLPPDTKFIKVLMKSVP
jgi:hypothetical protein